MSYIALKSGNMYFSESTASKRTYSKYAATKFKTIQEALAKQEELIVDDKYLVVAEIPSSSKNKKFYGKRPVDVFPDEKEFAN